MGIDISKVDTHTDSHVRISFTGVPEMKASYLDRMLLPDYANITYRYDAGAERWSANHITVAGHRLLKPAADGTPRVGKDHHKVDYSAWSGGDVQSDGNLPEWLDELVDELRPSGAVTLPGM